MKKYLMIILLVLTAMPSEARRKEASPYKYEINVAWSPSPEHMASELGYYSSWTIIDSDLDKLYGKYIGKSVTTGLVSADFNIQYREWFALGMQLSAAALTNTEMSPISGRVTGRFTDYSLSFLPYARLTWVNRLNLKMYSSLGLGLGYEHDAVPEDYHYEEDSYISGRCQFVPLGVTVGKKIYFMVEYGLGTEYMGFRFGVGYRF